MKKIDFSNLIDFFSFFFASENALSADAISSDWKVCVHDDNLANVDFLVQYSSDNATNILLTGTAVLHHPGHLYDPNMVQSDAHGGEEAQYLYCLILKPVCHMTLSPCHPLT